MLVAAMDFPAADRFCFMTEKCSLSYVGHVSPRAFFCFLQAFTNQLNLLVLDRRSLAGQGWKRM